MVTLGETNCQSFETAATRVFATESLTYYPEHYHAPFDGREGDSRGGGGREEASDGKEASREGDRACVC